VAPAPLPSGYVVMGNRLDVPPLLLYGVALQESAMRWGDRTLPWPWTLDVEGSPKRYASYADSVAALRRYLAAGVRNIDTGLMQVNWRHHSAKLQRPERALDPYPNIAVGAQILREQFNACADWRTAVGRYHSPGDPQRAASYAASVYRRIQIVPVPATRHG